MGARDGALRVAIQGERGAYSEEAALALYGGHIEVLACRTLEDVFTALQQKAADAAAVPVENSRAGTVVGAYDLLVRYPFHVYGERVQPIHHCLIGLPGARLEAIRRAKSHPQALSQCQEYLRRRDIEAVPAYDTAGSARDLQAENDISVAAVAARRAAEIYGLTILAEDIEDAPDNMTVFYAVGKPPVHPQRGGAGRTVAAFTVPNRPGSLVSCLEIFSRRRLNLSKLESRPSGVRPFEYVFYTVIEAQRDEPTCRDALEELEGAASSLRVIGSYRV